MVVRVTGSLPERVHVAVTVCVPALMVEDVRENGDDVSRVPIARPSMANWTPQTDSLVGLVSDTTQRHS